MKSIHKDGVKENLQENQIRIFLVNIVSKIYESELKVQSEKKNEKMQMQTAGRKQRSIIDNLIILNSIIKNQR